MSDMNNKVALITGASSGIGRTTAEVFAARGAKVVLAARREDELATLESEIKARGGEASFVVTDVAVAKDVERMVAHSIETYGRSETRSTRMSWDSVFTRNAQADPKRLHSPLFSCAPMKRVTSPAPL